jgi:hypothetical protein
MLQLPTWSKLSLSATDIEYWSRVFVAIKNSLIVYNEYVQVWLFYSLNICRVFFKFGTKFRYPVVCKFVFSITFCYKTLTNVHKIHFQIQSNTLPTWTPAYPLGARNLSHSSATSLNFHSNRCTIALLPSRAWGFFWAWMYATENKRHTRCSSAILQDVVPTHWKVSVFIHHKYNDFYNSVKSIMSLIF